MKKLMVLLVVATMVFGLGMTAFADDTEVCELSPELIERMLVIKEAFIDEKVDDGTLDSKTGADMLVALSKQTGSSTLRGLGFGSWLRDSEYAAEMLELMPHKNMGTRNGTGTRLENGGGFRGNNTENCLEDGEGFQRGGRGHRNNN